MTTSALYQPLALGDAVAVCLMRSRDFGAEDFARLHPGGSLGRRLSLVKDHMHDVERLTRIAPNADFHRVLEGVTANNFGIVAVVEGANQLAGAISDGDLRRALLKHDAAALRTRAKDLMSGQPKSIEPLALAIDAVSIMNEKQITQLFVVERHGAGKHAPETATLRGLIRLHDLLAAKIL